MNNSKIKLIYTQATIVLYVEFAVATTCMFEYVVSDRYVLKIMA